jgi:replication factor C small subunit
LNPGEINIQEIWIEKYRPNNLNEIVGQDIIIARLKSYVKAKNIPHMLFSGAAGTGKTSAAIAIAQELYGDNWHSNFIELNASDERGIDVVRNKIKNFARTAPLNSQFKIIFLDEADALTPDAQSALRRTMESYSISCRFILSCNYSSKIIEPIQSRCAIYRFKPVRDTDIKSRITFIADKEGLTLVDSALDAICYVANGDLRRAINTLQSSAAVKEDIDKNLVYQITSIAKPEDVNTLMHKATNGNFMGALKILDSLLVEQGLSASDIIDQIHRAVFSLEIPDKEKVKLIDRIGEIDFRLAEGASERIQLEALIAEFTLINLNN